jgi:hypothetical protein
MRRVKQEILVVITARSKKAAASLAERIAGRALDEAIGEEPGTSVRIKGHGATINWPLRGSSTSSEGTK